MAGFSLGGRFPEVTPAVFWAARHGFSCIWAGKPQAGSRNSQRARGLQDSLACEVLAVRGYFIATLEGAHQQARQRETLSTF